jgi:hypothetical protein
MNIDKPVVGPAGTLGPEYAEIQNDNYDIIDEHDHSQSKGKRVNVAGINIDGDLTFNTNNAIDARSYRGEDNSSVLVTTDDKVCMYFVSGDFHINNADGIPVKITDGTGLNLSSIGTIGGDYGQPGVPASVVYSDTTKIYSFTQDTGITAIMAIGDILLYENVIGANPITIKSPTSLGSAYNFIMPAAAATANSILKQKSDNSGLEFSTNPLYIDSANGRVGVKITNPQADFVIAGTEMRVGNASADTLLRLGSTGTSTNTHAVLRYDRVSNYFEMAISGVAAGSGVIINSLGNLGVGVNPTNYIHVPGGTATHGGIRVQNGNGNLVIGNFSGSGIPYIVNNAVNSTTTNTLKYLDSGIACTRIQFNNGIFSVDTSPTGTAGNDISFTSRLSVANNGHTTISATLGVIGATTLSSTLSAGATTLASLGVTGATTVGTTLGVTGATTLSSTLSAGATTLSSTLAVSGVASLSNGLTKIGASASPATATNYDTVNFPRSQIWASKSAEGSNTIGLSSNAAWDGTTLRHIVNGIASTIVGSTSGVNISTFASGTAGNPTGSPTVNLTCTSTTTNVGTALTCTSGIETTSGNGVIKWKKFSGTTTSGGQVSFAHGLTLSTIIGYDCIVEGGSNLWYDIRDHAAYPLGGHSIGTTNFTGNTTTNSSFHSSPYRAIIKYT